MISIRTMDSWGFINATLTTAAGSSTFLASAGYSSAAETMIDMVEWANADPAFSGAKWAWDWKRSLTGGGANLTLSCDNTFTATFNGYAQVLLGFSGSYPSADYSHTGVGMCAGGFAPIGVVDVRSWVRLVSGNGNGSGMGAVRGGVPGLSSRRPTVQWVANAVDLAKMVTVLRDATHSRVACIFQRTTSEWHVVALGKITVTPNGGVLTAVSAEVRG